MMHDVNWWLMALSFLLGLVLTFLFMIRRVTREVPIYAALGRGPKADVKAPDVDVKVPDVDVKKVAPVVAAAAAAPVAAKVLQDEPFGAGSARFAKSVAPPRAEYLIKGDEDTMRYFTVESPDYEKVGAEVWFKDTDAAERAGFLRWDAAAAAGAAAVTGAAAATSKVASVAGDSDEGPYGAGSARAGDGGVGPAGWLIKGNEDSGLYHTPASPSYDVTIAELWFVDEATAEAAGFKKYK